MSPRLTTFAALLSASALSGTMTMAQQVDCGVAGPLPAGCEPANAGDVVAIPAGANTEGASVPPVTGFAISVDGQTITGDRRVVNIARRADVALAEADVQVSFDGLGATPRLDLERVGTGPLRAGQSVRFQSALNYPAYVTRGEVRIIDPNALGGARVVAVVPIPPGGQAEVSLPQGDGLFAVHRVYDAAGRYDETAPLALAAEVQPGQIDGAEEGADSTARRGIPVQGGAITVAGSGVVPGARVTALGEPVTADPSGRFVIQRILPAGSYGVDVAINGAGQRVALTRDVTIPRSEWFTVGVADLTFGARFGDRTNGTETYTNGRLAFYVDGKTDSGVRITASADTGDGPLEDALRRLQDRDPRQLLLRVDPEDLYPTYGDDSTIEDRTPTSGRLFLRVEKEGNHLQWGDFDADLGDNTFVRNARSLYGLSGVAQTRDVTEAGEARARVLAYAAQPDMLPQRDTFRGTGGSVYFLQKQDIAQATDQVAVQVRDAQTGRIIETVPLVAGRDYEINYIQGILTLARPLASSTGRSLISRGTQSGEDVVLVAQYEYTPDAGDVDGFAYGARAEVWATDQIRLGLSGALDETGATDHQVIGADLLYRVSDGTYARVDIAQSEGTGFGSTFSADAGLIADTNATASGDGQAFKVEARADLAELGLGTPGAVSGYFERRTEGFSSQDVQVLASTGDETFWGVGAEVGLSETTTLTLSYDSYENDAGGIERDGAAELEFAVNPALKATVGLATLERRNGSEDGRRTDVAARLDYRLAEGREVYVFGQTAVDVSGLDRDDRYGVGAKLAFAENWSVEAEVSDGTAGTGGRVLVSYDDGAGNTRYLGYELEAGRELAGVTLSGRDGGKVVAGGRSVVSDTTTVFGETSYDMFGRHRTLTQAYGVTFAPTQALTYTVAAEFGRIEDAPDYDFERQALSFGVRYADDRLTAQGRVEYRTEDGVLSGSDVTSDTLLVTADATYKLDEAQRLVFSAKLARSETAQSALLDGNYTDVVLGYAYRPVEDDRLNVLARYRYLDDEYGQRLDDADTDGPRQRSHIVSVDASYDLDRTWTIGGKLGYRSSEVAANAAADYVANDAWLAVANARYHLQHDWEALIELRSLGLVQADTVETSVLGAVYKQLNGNVKVGVGYNFGTFSDDLSDLTADDQGAFINLVASF